MNTIVPDRERPGRSARKQVAEPQNQLKAAPQPSRVKGREAPVVYSIVSNIFLQEYGSKRETGFSHTILYNRYSIPPPVRYRVGGNL